MSFPTFYQWPWVPSSLAPTRPPCGSGSGKKFPILHHNGSGNKCLPCFTCNTLFNIFPKWTFLFLWIKHVSLSALTLSDFLNFIPALFIFSVQSSHTSQHISWVTIVCFLRKIFTMFSMCSSDMCFLSIALLSTLNSHSGYHLPFFPSPEVSLVFIVFLLQ